MINKMDDMWSRLLRAEEAAESDQLYAYRDDPEDRDVDADTDGNPDDVDPEDQANIGNYDDIDKEFADFEPQYEMSYTQMKHIGYGPVGMGTKIGGKFSKIERLIQQQTVSKEDLYLAKFRAIATNWVSERMADGYAEQIKGVPRFWLKKPEALIAALMLHKAGISKLKEIAKQTDTPEVDLYRYYRLTESVK